MDKDGVAIRNCLPVRHSLLTKPNVFYFYANYGEQGGFCTTLIFIFCRITMIMKQLFLLSFFFILSYALAAQQISIVKTTVVGGKEGALCKKMHPTKDGGIFWEGYAYDTTGVGDYPSCSGGSLVNRREAAGRLDANGDQIWTKFYCNGFQQPGGNCTPADDSFLIAGPGISDSANWTIPDLYVAGLDCDGNLRWQQRWGSSHVDGVYRAIPTTDGGFLAVGTSYGSDGDIPYHYTPPFPTSFQYTDVVVLKADSLGNKQWLKVYGSSTQDGCHHAIQVGSDYYIFVNAGTHDYDFISSAPYPPDSADNYIVKIDDSGNTVWTRCIGSLAVNDVLFDEVDSTFMIISACDLNYPPFYFQDTTPPSQPNYGLVKINLEGQVVWAKNYGSLYDNELPSGVCKGPDNSYIIVGEVHGAPNPTPPKIGNYDGLIVWVDSSGNEITHKYFGSTDDEVPEKIERIANNKFIIATSSVRSNTPFTEGAWHYNPGVEHGIGFTVVELWPTAVNDVTGKVKKLTIYPNPSDRQLTVVLPGENENYTLAVYDPAGKKTDEYKKVKQKELTISTASWHPGQYIIRCVDKQGTVWVAQAIITH